MNRVYVDLHSGDGLALAAWTSLPRIICSVILR